jgi:lysozyme
MVQGIDVSHSQGRIVWEDVATAGAKFAFIKATEGVTFKDDRYIPNVSGAQRAGLLVGSFHFFIAGSNGAKQAEHFLKTVGNLEGQLPPVLDIERQLPHDSNGKLLSASVKAWLDRVEDAWGIKPIIYANPYYCQTLLAPYLAEYPLWLANYAEQPSTSIGAWQEWLFWQNTDHGRWPGVNVGTNVDLDYFNGDEEALKALSIPTKKMTTLVKVCDYVSGDILMTLQMVPGGDHISDQRKVYITEYDVITAP